MPDQTTSSEVPFLTDQSTGTLATPIEPHDVNQASPTGTTADEAQPEITVDQQRYGFAKPIRIILRGNLIHDKD
jgi:hypothetical protein